ncbi:MAG TPA: phosphatidate cytidylyltransferase [Cytophagaceae bacterium]|jgi:phosphatidate cytidylyltransferase|nr:phosphatidate cytidylyltransferase [Cytophagaceae bacterium]
MNKLSNLTLRIIFGLIGAAVVVTGVLYNEWTFLLLFSLICGIALTEFFHLLHRSHIHLNRLFAVASGLLLFSINYLIQNNTLTSNYYYLVVAFVFLLFLIELFQTNTNPFHRIANTFLGVLYIALPLALFSSAAFIHGTYDYTVVMGILLLLWANDIGGYIGGVSFGKHKLFERVSPKKTWEGSIGGALFSLGIAWTCAHFFPHLSLLNWVILSLIIIVFGSIGDLVESLFKRNLSVKDSGNLIPGHGGFLDRFDGLFIASPFLLMYLKVFVS